MKQHTLRLLTQNTHSHAEEQYESKLLFFAEGIAALQPDVIALQEVNQSKQTTPVLTQPGYRPAHDGIVIGKDNHLYRITQLVRQLGYFYYWTWLPIKTAYGSLTEGIGLMSRSPITAIRYGRISQTDDPENWKRRMILGIQTQAHPDSLFYSTHMARWDDAEEPFLHQWKTTLSLLPQAKTIWLMGDFNNPAHVHLEGYNCIRQSGWYDTFSMAQMHDAGITVDHAIDGWRDHKNIKGMRMDQIWCSRPVTVSRSQVVFDGKIFPVISDHYGVMVDIIST